MNALVLGYGRSGRAAEALLCRSGHRVTVLDGNASFPDGAFDLAVVSPGIALTHSWIVEAKRRGIPLKSELQLGCEELRRQGWDLLAVTGSKGKSSVVKLVAEALGGVPCGNYGLPVCEVATGSRRADGETRTADRGPRTARRAVVEVSSFMLETTDLPPDAFEAAVILNLQEDHLDRHGSVEAYHGLKRKLLSFSSRSLACGGGAGRGRPVHESSGGCALFEGSYFDNAVLRENGLAAVWLMRNAGLGDAEIRRAFRDFVPLPHRMNQVAVINGVRYVDDSKATSGAALAAGVVMASPCPVPGSLPPDPCVRLVAGGLPKGDDPRSALPVLTGRVRKVYLIGQSAEAFRAAWQEAVDCEICGTMARAVERATCEAGSGETVLLSPGTASFDQFKSFGERGEVFARLVKEKENDK